MKQISKWKILLVLITCLASIIFSLPSFINHEKLRFLPNWILNSSVNLGLDLRGGSHLLLEVDFNQYLKEQLELLKDESKNILRAENIALTQIKITDYSIIMNFSNEEDLDSAKEILKKKISDIEISENDKFELVITYKNEAVTRMKDQVMNQSIEIIRRRVDESGTKEPSIQRQGSSYILLQVPGLNNPTHLKELLGKTAKLTFHIVNTEAMSAENGRIIPFNSKIVVSEEKNSQGHENQYIIFKKSVLNGDSLTDAGVNFDEYGRPAVSFKFNSFGARKFGEITKNNSGKALAIILDDKVISAPIIEEPILGGSGIIRGKFTSKDANDLALLLRAGALPAPINIAEERVVGPTLGSDSIDAGMRASIIGTFAVMLFMFICYGLFGLFANIALIFNLFFIIAILALFHATLTMPGIAGIVLTMGMAVDANVLIFERIREEAKLNMSAAATIDRGFNQAYATILDSNLTTIFATLILYFFGTGAIKGFAIALLAGIISSMFSAITITKLMIQIYFRKSKIRGSEFI